MNKLNIPKQAYEFNIHGEPIFCAPFGSGHINSTFLLVDSTGTEYILQKINKTIFRDPAALMQNIILVTEHLHKTVKTHREALSLIKERGGGYFHIDSDGEYWRAYRYISDSICMNLADDPAVFRQSGVAFGGFARRLADFPAHKLNETIPRFHDTKNRYAAFKAAINADAFGRASAVQKEIDFSLEREEYAGKLLALQAGGELPLRVTHNDTKLNNVLFDRDSRKALCVIDLDTVMPGLSVNDFGDSIRFGAATAAEDERDLTKMNFSLELYEAYADGYLSACGQSLTSCELEHLRDGAKMMTLECGVRFLTDYLSGDSYFKTSREGHNLDRCRTQFKLVAEMEKVWDKMMLRNLNL